VIPTIPDIVSTWGIFQIVSRVATFADELGRPIKPLGIIAAKVNGVNTLHQQVMRVLREGKLFDGNLTDLTQPPLFEHIVKEGTVTARGAEFDANISTFKQKYGQNADALLEITKELIERCNRALV
jgi:chromosome partitioning protein